MNGPYPPLMGLKEKVRNSTKLCSSSVVMGDSQNRNHSKKNSDSLSGCSNTRNMSNSDCNNTDNNSSNYKKGGIRFNYTSCDLSHGKDGNRKDNNHNGNNNNYYYNDNNNYYNNNNNNNNNDHNGHSMRLSQKTIHHWNQEDPDS